MRCQNSMSHVIWLNRNLSERAQMSKIKMDDIFEMIIFFGYN